MTRERVAPVGVLTMRLNLLGGARGIGARYRRGLAAALGVALAVMLGVTPALAQATSGNPNPGVVPPNSRAFGKSLGEWSAAWWQWALSIPASENPLFDQTGADCDVKQSGKVWFLAGTFSGPVTRTCTIPTGTAILIPIINTECSTVEPPPFFGKNEAELRACAKGFVDGVGAGTLKATIDGVSVPALARFRTQSPVFPFTMPPDDNILGLPGVTQGKAVSDGYWLLLHPLPPGKHVIHVEGAFVSGPGAGFSQDVTYNLTVVPGRSSGSR